MIDRCSLIDFSLIDFVSFRYFARETLELDDAKIVVGKLRLRTRSINLNQIKKGSDIAAIDVPSCLINFSLSID
jgi:7-cyano-7-deazaguanine synthase in queuosine biosynthesis